MARSRRRPPWCGHIGSSTLDTRHSFSLSYGPRYARHETDQQGKHRAGSCFELAAEEWCGGRGLEGNDHWLAASSCGRFGPRVGVPLCDWAEWKRSNHETVRFFMRYENNLKGSLIFKTTSNRVKRLLDLLPCGWALSGPVASQLSASLLQTKVSSTAGAATPLRHPETPLHLCFLFPRVRLRHRFLSTDALIAYKLGSTVSR